MHSAYLPILSQGDVSSKTNEITENMEQLSQLKNVTIGELCSIPCNNNDQKVPEMICDLCKDVSEEDKVLTLGQDYEKNPKKCSFLCWLCKIMLPPGTQCDHLVLK